MEYAPIILIMYTAVKRLKGIQYQALKIIYKEKNFLDDKFDPISSKYLHDLSGFESIEERIYKLSTKYLENVIINKNPLILKIIAEASHSAFQRSTPLEKIGQLFF